LESMCLWCQDKVNIYDLRKYDEPIYYSPAERRVNGLIVCRHCVYELDDSVECYDCGNFVSRNDARYVDGIGYICDSCFEDWFYCDECGEPHRREHFIFTPDDRVICEWCATKLGAVCSYCGEFVYFDKEKEDEKSIQQYEINRGNWLDEIYLCNECAENHLRSYQCQCGQIVYYLDVDFKTNDRLRDMVRLDNCLECYHRRRREAFEDAFENRMHASLFTFSAEPGERILKEILTEE
jgi:hypothetical protein